MKLCTIWEPDARAMMEGLAFLERIVNGLDGSSLPPDLIKWGRARGVIHHAQQTLEHALADDMPPAIPAKEDR